MLFLSHTLRCNTTGNRIRNAFCRANCTYFLRDERFGPLALKPPERPRSRFCNTGTSCANKRSPSGSIQSPSTGKKLKTPPNIRKTATASARSAKTACAATRRTLPAAAAACLRTRQSAGLFPFCNVRSPDSPLARRCGRAKPPQGVSLSRAQDLNERGTRNPEPGFCFNQNRGLVLGPGTPLLPARPSFRWFGTKEDAARRRELRLVADHAGGDHIDVGNERAAESHRIGRASLLLLGE